MQEKPGISLTVLHLFCSENTCVTLAGETRTPGLTTPEVMLAAERCSGSLWARCYCGSLEQAQAPLLPHLFTASPCSTNPPESNGFPLLQGWHPGHILLDFTWPALPNHPSCLRPQTLPHPRTYNAYPHPSHWPQDSFTSLHKLQTERQHRKIRTACWVWRGARWSPRRTVGCEYGTLV